MRLISIFVCVIALAGAMGWAAGVEPVRQDAQDVVAPDTAALLRELRDLRADVLRLQQTVDSLVEGELAQLRIENERLRKEVGDLSGMTGQTLPPVPMPDRALLEGLYASKKAKDAKEKAEPPSETVPDADNANPVAEPQQSSEKNANDIQEKPAKVPAKPQPFKFEIVDEWGRTPEEVASNNHKAASLKGIIGVVPTDSSDEDLSNLGRSLHEQYAAFDNVNIEVFDNIEAARAYKGKYIAPPKHRVLSISKHKASNRDVVLLIRDDTAVAVPLAAAATPQ